MTDPSPAARKRIAKRAALRFASIWTTVNGLFVILAVARVLTGGAGRQPMATGMFILIFLLIVVMGLVRIRSLRADLAQLSSD